MLKLLRLLLRLLFRFDAYNETVLATRGPVLLLPNHVSWFDWLFLGVCLDRDWRFVTSSTTARASPIHRWIMVNRRTFSIDPASPYAVKQRAVVLFTSGSEGVPKGVELTQSCTRSTLLQEECRGRSEFALEALRRTSA